MQTIAVDARPLRWAGIATLGAVAALPIVPGHDALACPLRATTGIPCPFCGVTRGVQAVLDGDLGGALALNPGSVLLVLGVVALVLAVAVRRPRLRVPWWIPVAAIGALWAFQLVKSATGRPL